MKLTNKELFEYAEKQLSKLTDEQRDRVRRYLNYKFKTNLIFNITFFSIFWTFSEIFRGYLLTGFPWNLLAHTLSDFDALIQIGF